MASAATPNNKKTTAMVMKGSAAPLSSVRSRRHDHSLPQTPWDALMCCPLLSAGAPNPGRVQICPPHLGNGLPTATTDSGNPKTATGSDQGPSAPTPPAP